ncbi:SsgA family sporulation/cell division regulator [Streptomyces sp. NPDC096538]|uniref:SsgA family sporulation/cell division regulator n=1 Tax=Streptomyces sp. NPDC096538 TaxID=3155427 RepID=UPI003322F3DB
MDSHELELNVCLTLRAASDLHVRVPVRFSYSDRDPYAVQATFHIAPGQVVHWMFARDLLDGGMQNAVGIGDVKVAPVESSWGRCFSIELETPDGYACLTGAVAPVSAWIAKTYEAVPAGCESAFLDIDRFLDEHSGR